MLTKSDYIKGIQCLKWLWIHKNDKSRIPELSPIEEAKFEEGYAIEELAKLLFPDSIDLSDFSFNEQIRKKWEKKKSKK